LAHPSRAPVRVLLVAGLIFSSGSVSAQAGPQPASPAASADAAVTVLAAQAQRDSIVAVARRQIGRRYVFGGTSPEQGFDCSGFLRYLMRAVGRDLPRTAAQQAQVGAAVPRDPALLRPGDILTFGRGRRITHVAVYVGEGRYIHASSGAGRIVESELDRPQSALVRAWAGVRRLLSPEADASVAVRPDATPVSPDAPRTIRGG
jgi:cell wall-associated NlpC family hydrolase